MRFVADGLREVTQGSAAYHLWMALLTLVMLAGAYAYSVQLREGLVVTGMHDHVSWGLYISSFTFLVGVAAAAVILVMPTYVLHDHDFKSAVLFGEGIAVAALVTAIGFVAVDVGGPARLWHLVPGLGLLNWPRSMLAWDILVLTGYLALNLLIPFYILFSHYRDREPNPRLYVPAVLLSILWAVSLHLVTAFLYAGLPARPYWNSALLGPKFLATAFAAGPALMIIILALIRRHTGYRFPTPPSGSSPWWSPSPPRCAWSSWSPSCSPSSTAPPTTGRAPGTYTSASRATASWWAGSGRRSVSPCSPRPC